MAIRSFKKMGSDDDINRIQDNIDAVLRPLQASAIGQGNLLTGVALINGSTEVEHKLGRELIGWIIVQQNANAPVWDRQSTNVKKSRTLVLNSTASMSVTLWVF